MVKSTKVRVVLVIAIVVVAASVVFAIMALADVFHSDKAKAIELLLQMRERVSWTSTEKYVGAEEIAEKLLQKGGTVDLEMSKMQFDTTALSHLFLGESAGDDSITGALFGSLDWSEYVLEMNSQVDLESGRTSNAMMVSKGEDSISIIRCSDEDEEWVALPELLEGKVFHMQQEERQKIYGSADTLGEKNLTQKDMLALFSDLNDFIVGNAGGLRESITCEKIRKKDLDSRGDAGYTLQIPKDKVNALLDELAAVLNAQENEIFHDIGASVAGWTVSEDIELKVYGENDILSRIEVLLSAGGEKYELVFDFEGQSGDSKATFTVKGNIRNVPTATTIILTDKEGKKCENTVDITVAAQGQQAVHVKLDETVTPDSGSYQMNGMFELVGSEPYYITANGSIKDLKQGICVSYILDDVKISVGDSELMSMAMKLQFAAKEGSLEPPQGEVIELTSETTDEDMEQYTEELQKNLENIIANMGFPFWQGISGGLL